MIRGTRISLRPTSQSDLSTLIRWVNDPESSDEFADFGLVGSTAFARSFAENGLLTEFEGYLMIVSYEDAILGGVDYHQVPYGPNPASRAYHIGVHLETDFRGQGYGSEAQFLLTRYLFATYPIMRVEAATDINNSAECRSLEKAGFSQEGVLRQAQWRRGHWRDLALYSKIRAEQDKHTIDTSLANIRNANNLHIEVTK